VGSVASVQNVVGCPLASGKASDRNTSSYSLIPPLSTRHSTDSDGSDHLVKHYW